MYKHQRHILHVNLSPVQSSHLFSFWSMLVLVFSLILSSRAFHRKLPLKDSDSNPKFVVLIDVSFYKFCIDRLHAKCFFVKLPNKWGIQLHIQTDMSLRIKSMMDSKVGYFLRRSLLISSPDTWVWWLSMADRILYILENIMLSLWQCVLCSTEKFRFFSNFFRGKMDESELIVRHTWKFLPSSSHDFLTLTLPMSSWSMVTFVICNTLPASPLYLQACSQT